MSLRRYEALRRWRKTQAESRGVSPIVVLSSDEIRRLAHAPEENPEPAAWLDCLSGYKRAVYGEQLLAILNEKPSPHPKKRR
jgi:ribonuclease D